ncbi:hypothetical protein MMPV_002611 [Pyropia vietnamensis]
MDPVSVAAAAALVWALLGRRSSPPPSPPPPAATAATTANASSAAVVVDDDDFVVAEEVVPAAVAAAGTAGASPFPRGWLTRTAVPVAAPLSSVSAAPPDAVVVAASAPATAPGRGSWSALPPPLVLLFLASAATHLAVVAVTATRRRSAAAAADLAAASDLAAGPRRVVVLTTAALPWMTGTAVNAACRAQYLAGAGHDVTLVVPWVGPAGQARVFGGGVRYANRDEQRAFILEWLATHCWDVEEEEEDEEAGEDGDDDGEREGDEDGDEKADGAAEAAGAAGEGDGSGGSGSETDGRAPTLPIRVEFYDGAYSDDWGSILPVGDLTALFTPAFFNPPRAGGGVSPPPSDAAAAATDPPPPLTGDVLILEEPEHLTWHHTGPPYTRLFRYVVGVIHTNYVAYVRASGGSGGAAKARALYALNRWVCRAYTHRVIKLSAAVQPLPHAVVAAVHGVRPAFLAIGDQVGAALAAAAAADAADAAAAAAATAGTTNLSDGDGPAIVATLPPPGSAADAVLPGGAYFLGKVLWAKGYRQLLDVLTSAATPPTPDRPPLPLACYGGGPDTDAVRAAVAATPALSRVTITGRVVDHASPELAPYRVCVNPSTSDVLCTVTAEALAMGKYVLVREHPSNDWFAAHFRNCVTYADDAAFVARLRGCLAAPPAPLSADERRRLSWEAATRRFYDAAALDDRRRGGVDRALAGAHKRLCRLGTPPGFRPPKGGGGKAERGGGRGAAGVRESADRGGASGEGAAAVTANNPLSGSSTSAVAVGSAVR